MQSCEKQWTEHTTLRNPSSSDNRVLEILVGWEETFFSYMRGFYSTQPHETKTASPLSQFTEMSQLLYLKFDHNCALVCGTQWVVAAEKWDGSWQIQYKVKEKKQTLQKIVFLLHVWLVLSAWELIRSVSPAYVVTVYNYLMHAELQLNQSIWIPPSHSSELTVSRPQDTRHPPSGIYRPHSTHLEINCHYTTAQHWFAVNYGLNNYHYFLSCIQRGV